MTTGHFFVFNKSKPKVKIVVGQGKPKVGDRQKRGALKECNRHRDQSNNPRPDLRQQIKHTGQHSQRNGRKTHRHSDVAKTNDGESPSSNLHADELLLADLHRLFDILVSALESIDEVQGWQQVGWSKWNGFRANRGPSIICYGRQ